jgi:uncharacterized protein (DUF4415 family)
MFASSTATNGSANGKAMGRSIARTQLPELTDEMLGRAVFKKAGRPRSPNPKQLISLRLPPEVIARWRATGPGWQTRMAKRLEDVPPPQTSDKF